MPTWEVAARAGLEVALSLVCALLVIKALRALTAKAIKVIPLDFKQLMSCTSATCTNAHQGQMS